MNLLRIELKKIVPYYTFWIILAVYAALLILVMMAASNISINGGQLGTQIYQFPKLWQLLTYIASFFNLLLGILIIVLVTDGYSYRTLRQQVIDGMSRTELVLAKFYVILGIGAAATIFLLLVGLYFGFRHSTDTSMNAILGQIDHLSYFFVQAVGYMTLAMLFGFLVKRSGMAIIIFILYAQVLEPILQFWLNDAIDQYLPIKAFKSLTPMPGQELLDQMTTPTGLLQPAWATLPALCYIGLFLLLAYYSLKLRDL